MKKWTSYSGYTVLLNENGTKMRDLPPKSVIKSTEETKEVDGVLLERVILADEEDIDGWVDVQKIEPYNENFPCDCVDVKDIQTHSLRDAEQYVIWEKASSQTQVNMCGELCVCFILEKALSEMLNLWQQAEPSFWSRVFGGGVARGTYAEELVKMFELFGKKAKTLAEYKRYTPGLLTGLIGAIVGVRINTTTGRLIERGNKDGNHWVVVTDLMNERAGYGLVYVYNPFPNRIEVYSYAEFVASALTPYGAILADKSEIKDGTTAKDEPDP